MTSYLIFAAIVLVTCIVSALLGAWLLHRGRIGASPMPSLPKREKKEEPAMRKGIGV
jgi:hypothetical protein